MLSKVADRRTQSSPGYFVASLLFVIEPRLFSDKATTLAIPGSLGSSNHTRRRSKYLINSWFWFPISCAQMTFAASMSARL